MSEWRRIRLGDHAETFAGGTPDRSNAAFFGGLIPWVKSTEVNLGRIKKTEDFLTEEGLHFSAAKWIPARTVLVAMYGATAAQIAYLEIAATANQAVLAVIPDEHIDSVFLFYALTAIKEKILFQAQGSGQPNLNKQIIDRVTVDLPSISEQHRIAEILSTLDEAIEQTEALIAKHQQIKAGLMHDLFTRGVTPDGHLRPTREQAPDLYKPSPLGWIPKEWAAELLRYFVPNVAYGISCSLDENPAGVPVLRMNNIMAGQFNISDVKFSRSDEARLLTLKDGDVLFNRTNSLEHVGKTAIWRGELPSASFASYLVRLDVDVQKMSPSFLAYWLNLPITQIGIRRFATPGVHQVNINPTNLRRMMCTAPTNLLEQDAIANRIEQSAALIASEESKLAKLHQQKHGLMHDLLTGRVRVKVNEVEVHSEST